MRRRLHHPLWPRGLPRPLTATEIARYKTLWQEAAKAEDFAGGIHWTIAAMLQSPGFLYRSELGEHVGDGIYELTAHELATELSYLIVGGPPDAELAAAADDGTLSDPETLQAHAARRSPAPTATAPCTASSTSGCTSIACRWSARPPALPRAEPGDREAMLGETHRFVTSATTAAAPSPTCSPPPTR